VNANHLILRCYAEFRTEGWQAFCLDLCLAVQGERFIEVQTKLGEQIVDFIQNATVGEDQAFAEQLLTRRAPFGYWLKYHWIKFTIQFGSQPYKTQLPFNNPLPLIPAIR